jgi:hypothetical protein
LSQSSSYTPPAALLAPSRWQMSYGERAALEGLLSQIKPRIAIEIGTAEGGSLERIAAHSDEVHSFDLVEPDAAARRHDNVRLHTGDSHTLLPRLLAELADHGRNVDFVLVDGDHSADGVRRDMQDLLDSAAVAHTVIVMHDTMNEEVRRGLEALEYGAWPKVAYVELDLVAGYMFRDPDLRHELWGGLGLVVVDATRTSYFSAPARQRRYYETHHLVRFVAGLVAEAPPAAAGAEEWKPVLDDIRERHAAELRERDEAIRELEQRLGECNDARRGLEASVSWRLTRPLRTAKRRLLS